MVSEGEEKSSSPRAARVRPTTEPRNTGIAGALAGIAITALAGYHALGHVGQFLPFVWDFAGPAIDRLPRSDLIAAGARAWGHEPFLPWVITLVMRLQAASLAKRSILGAAGLAGLALIIDIGGWFMMDLPRDGDFAALAVLLLVEAAVIAAIIALRPFARIGAR